MAGGNGRKKRKRKQGRRMKRKPGGSSSSSASSSSDDVSPQPVEEQGGLVVRDGYEWGWHNALFVGTKGSVDIMASVRDQILKTCFICAILYAAEQDIRRWLAIEEPDRKPEIYFDFDTYVAQYEAEVQNLIGPDVRFFYRSRENRPRNALKVFLRDGVLAYSKSKEWLGGKIIKITHFLFHKDMIFSEFEDIIANGGSVIGGFTVGIEFMDLQPDAIYQFSPPGIKRESAGAHMVQFIGTGIDVEREFLVFLNSKKRFGKDGVGKVYFDQIYNGVYTLECRAPPPPPPSDDSGLIASGADDNDDTLGSSSAAPGNNESSFSGAPDGNEAQSSTAPTTSFSEVRKCNSYDDDPISSSCTIKIDGWVLSAPALLIEDIQTRKERPWKKENLDEMGTVTRCFVPSNNMNDLHFVNVLLKICYKHYCQIIPNVPYRRTEGVISHAKIEDIRAMESRHRENRQGLLKLQAARAVKQKEHKMASWIFSLAIFHKESVALYANRRLCELLMGDGEDALSAALRCRMLRPDWAKACYRQAAAHMLLKEYEQARDALLDAQKLYPGNAEIESERKAWELMKNPPVESAY